MKNTYQQSVAVFLDQARQLSGNLLYTWVSRPAEGKPWGAGFLAQQPLHEVAALGSVPVPPPALFLVGTGGEGARASKNRGAHTSQFLWDDPKVVAKAGWEGHTDYICFSIGGQKPIFEGY